MEDKNNPPKNMNQRRVSKKFENKSQSQLISKHDFMKETNRNDLLNINYINNKRIIILI